MLHARDKENSPQKKTRIWITDYHWQSCISWYTFIYFLLFIDYYLETQTYQGFEEYFPHYEVDQRLPWHCVKGTIPCVRGDCGVSLLATHSVMGLLLALASLPQSTIERKPACDTMCPHPSWGGIGMKKSFIITLIYYNDCFPWNVWAHHIITEENMPYQIFHWIVMISLFSVNWYCCLVI